MKKIITISIDFSDAPGGRHIADGPNSGEEFREKYLVPAMKDKGFDHIVVDFDGGYGYATSFLEEAFGGLARIYGVTSVMEKLSFVSSEEPSLIDEVKKYIREGINEE